MALLKMLPGPDAIAAEPDGVKELLRKASRGRAVNTTLQLRFQSRRNDRAVGTPVGFAPIAFAGLRCSSLRSKEYAPRPARVSRTSSVRPTEREQEELS